MTNIEKLNAIFTRVFACQESELGASFTKENIGLWDSVHQLSITTQLEDEFDIMLDVEDIIACDSYESAKAILAKYEIEL